MLGETDNSICRVNGKNTRLTTTLRVLVFCLSLVPFLVAPQGAIAVTATDNFARGNGSLGPEIADILNLTEETARWRVFKARQKLLQALKPGPREAGAQQ